MDKQKELKDFIKTIIEKTEDKQLIFELANIRNKIPKYENKHDDKIESIYRRVKTLMLSQGRL